MGPASWGDGVAPTPLPGHRKAPGRDQGSGAAGNSEAGMPPPPPPPSAEGEASQSPQDGASLFSPRSTAAMALSSFSQNQHPQQDEEHRRDFSPPAAFDPPRATLRGPAKQQMTEIQPRQGNAAAFLAQRQPPPPKRQQPRHLLSQHPPPFPPYYAVPHWEYHRQRQHPPVPMPPMPANAWQPPLGADQQHPSQLSSTSLLPDPRVSAISTSAVPPPPPPPPPHLPPGSKPRGTLAAAHPASFRLQHAELLSQPLQPMSQNPYHSHTRPRPPPHTFVTPTPKKLRMSDAVAASVGRTDAQPSASAEAEAPPDRVRQQVQEGAAAASASRPAAAFPSSYSRKTKSLGVLAENFCQIFAGRPAYTEIIIDGISADLGVERRRIYDVVNILESIRVVVKKAKNTYCWMGSDHLPCMFALLQREAFELYPDDAVRHGLLRANPPPRPPLPSAQRAKDTRSLSRLSQHFLEVYLAGTVEISLPDASDKIHGETSVNQLAALGSRGREPVDVFDAKKFQQAAARGLKTKIRRLYDIANVFITLGILTKLENTGLRSNNDRPTFRWTFRVSASELIRIYETMPDYMKHQQTPFQKGSLFLQHRQGVPAAPLSLSWAEEGPELFPSCSSGSIEPPRLLLPPQPSPTSSEEADGPAPPQVLQHSQSEGSLMPASASAVAGDQSDKEPRRISFPVHGEARLDL